MRVVGPIVYFLNLVVVRKTLNLYFLKIACVGSLIFTFDFIYDHFRTTRFANLIR
jgi:hypothetical protein